MKKAVTLIEILLVVTLSALLMTAIIPFIRSVSDTWNIGAGRTEILQNGRAALETMTRYIRQARRITQIPDSTQIKIRDRDDKFDITFYYVSAQKNLMMRSNQTGSDVDSLLAPGVDSLTFNFLQDNGNPATRAIDVKSVQIQMVLSDPLGSITYTLALEDTVTWRQDRLLIWAINDGDDKLKDIAYETVASGFNINNAVSNCLSINPEDLSCWVADRNNNSIKNVSWTGVSLVNLANFSNPRAVSVNSVLLENGQETVWVADTGGDRIRRIYWTGTTWTYTTITTIGASPNTFSGPSSVSVNPYERVNSRETVWVADTSRNRVCRIYWTGTTWTSNANNIATGFTSPRSVSVNPNEIINGRNTCWVAVGTNNTTYGVRKIYWTGSAYAYSSTPSGGVWQGSAPRSVSVNTNDGTCWVANSGTGANGGNRVRKLSCSGICSTITTLAERTGFSTPYSVSVNSADDTCWVADYGHDWVVRLDANGNIEWSVSGFNSPMAVSVGPSS